MDGHDLEQLTKVLQEAKKLNSAVLVHVLTKKGKGYAPAERHPARFHGAEPFDIETGLPAKKRTKASYTDIFSTVMRKFGDRYPECSCGDSRHAGWNRPEAVSQYVP